MKSLKLSQKLYKQDVTQSDSTDTARLTLWQEDIDKLEEEHSYSIKDLLVRSYDGKKYLTPPKTGAKITAVDDDANSELESAEVLVVSYIAASKCCISCKAKVDNIDDHIGSCTKCSTTQRLDKCGKQLSAKLIIGNEDKTYSLHAFLPMIQKIIEDMTITDDLNTDQLTVLLLSAKPFIAKYTPNNIISAVY